MFTSCFPGGLPTFEVIKVLENSFEPELNQRPKDLSTCHYRRRVKLSKLVTTSSWNFPSCEL